MTELRSNILQVRPDHANRCVIVGDRVISRPTLILNHAEDAMRVLDWRPDKGQCYRKTNNKVYGNKAFNQELCQYLGLPPKKWARAFNAVAIDVWVKPIEWYVNRLARGMGGKIDCDRVQAIWKHREVLDQARRDGIENVIPILLALGRTPETARHALGRSKWRRIANNSFSRNKLLYYYSIEAINLPSTVIPYLFRSGAPMDGLEWASRNSDRPLKDRARVLQLAQYYDDTGEMAYRIGAPFNPKWSRRRMLEEHDRLTKAITAGKYSDEAFTLHRWIGDLTVEDGGWTASWLKSPAEIAEEGHVMKHCVAAYVTAARRDKYAVFSVRDPSGERYSTVGIRLETDKKVGLFPMMHQHYRAMNQDVTDAGATNIAETARIALKDAIKERMAA